MKEKTCRCGASKKRFKYDIGEFYIAECCESRFDHLGNEKLPEGESVGNVTVSTQLQPGETQEQAENRVIQELTEGVSLDDGGVKVEPEKVSTWGKLYGKIALKPGRGKLRDMTRDALVKLATEKNLKFSENATKNELIALILG